MIRLLRVQAAIALLVGVVAACAAVWWVDRGREATSVDVELNAVTDRVENAVTALEQDGVYVAPDGRRYVDEVGEEAIEDAVAASSAEGEVYVVVWAGHTASGPDLEEQFARLIDEQAILIVWDGPPRNELLELNTRVYGGAYSSDLLGDPAVAIPRAIESYDDTDWEAVDSTSTLTSTDDYWGGLPGGSVIGLFLGGGIVGALVLIEALLRRAGLDLPGRWLPTDRTPPELRTKQGSKRKLP